MKRLRILLAILLLASFHGISQDDENESKGYRTGGFGHFYIGPSVFFPGDLGDYLERRDVINADVNPRSTLMIGGEGMALNGRFLIGGGGYGMTSPSYSSDSAKARINMGGGYFKMGYLLKNGHPHLMFAYADIGFAGMNVEIHNFKDEGNVNFNTRNPVPPGRIRNYVLGGFSFSPGLSWKIVTGLPAKERAGVGGFMIGLDLGCSFFFPADDWQFDNQVVVGPPVPGAFASPYLKLTIGGGGFAFEG